MLAQALQGLEVAVAKVALVRVAVPRVARHLVPLGAVPAEQLLGDQARWVLGPHYFVHLVPVQEGSSRAVAAL